MGHLVAHLEAWSSWTPLSHPPHIPTISESGFLDPQNILEPNLFSSLYFSLTPPHPTIGNPFIISPQNTSEPNHVPCLCCHQPGSSHHVSPGTL